MFPWNYGFHWSTGNAVFLSAFYAVVAIVAVTVIVALIRARRASIGGRAEEIRWLSDFHELPAHSRACRYALTGKLPGRECPNAFDCRRCEKHAQLVAAHRPSLQPQAEEEIFGMAFPLDRLYYRGHTWVRREADGTFSVGLDELARRLVASAEHVELPRPGTRLRINGTAWRIRKHGADVRVLAPVDGIVVESGAPDRGGCLRLKPVMQTADLRHLLGPGEVRAWILREMERLQLALSAAGDPALADGGIPVEDIAANYPNADWDAVCGEMFLEG
jgi:glycine cleavage system H protein